MELEPGWVRGPREDPTGPIQEEVRASLLKTQRECRCRQSIWETWKEKEKESCLSLGPGVFNEDYGLVHMSSQASRNKDTRLGVLPKSLMPWSQGSWWVIGLEKCSWHDDPVTPWMLSVVLEDAKEIINSLTFKRRTYIISSISHM